MTDSHGFPGPVVRDYLYVDLERVRSLLAQLAEGLPDAVVERSKGLNSLSADLNLGLFRAGGRRDAGAEVQESRSLGDLHFSLFEEGAEALGLLTDLSEIASERANWHSGKLQAELQESQLIRVTGPVRLIDPTHVSEMMTRLEAMIEAYSRMTSAQAGNPAPSGSATKRTTSRPQHSGRVTPKVVGGIHAGAITALGALVSSLLVEGISMRCMPCGEDNPECSFAGIMLDRTQYIEPERGAIFNRFGFRPATWTLVALVTRFGAPTSDAPFSLDPNEPFTRMALERVVTQMLEQFERTGLTDAPTWPTIGVTPLALYRVVVPGT